MRGQDQVDPRAKAARIGAKALLCRAAAQMLERTDGDVPAAQDALVGQWQDLGIWQDIARLVGPNPRTKLLSLFIKLAYARSTRAGDESQAA